MYKPRILNKDAVDANDLSERKRVFAGLQYGVSPSFQAVARRSLALDGKAGPAIREQQETRGARDQVCPRPAYGFPRGGREVLFQEITESPGAPNDWAERGVAEQIVADAMPPRKARLPREIGFWIEKFNGFCPWRVVHAKGAPGQMFIEIPRLPRRYARRRGTHQSLHLALRHRLEDPLQDQEVKVFVAKRKDQVIGKVLTRPIPFVEDAPPLFLPAAPAHMLFGDRARIPHGGLDSERMHERCPPGQSGTLGDILLLEDREAS